MQRDETNLQLNRNFQYPLLESDYRKLSNLLTAQTGMYSLKKQDTETFIQYSWPFTINVKTKI